MTCPRCASLNSDEAVYCNQCGQILGAASSSSIFGDAERWRQFIGPRDNFYLERFRKFRESGERFVPTWHWPAFLVGWLWYLYRKMYLHSAIFLFGGLLPMVLGAGPVGVVIWNIFAAVAANYLYYMHVKLSLVVIERRSGLDPTGRDRLIHDAGGVQPYVWWLGFGLMVLAFAASMIEKPSLVKPPDSGEPA